MLLAKIYIEKTVYHIDRPFEYIIPLSMEKTLKRGCRVLVPFGRANKKVQGICVDVYEGDSNEIWSRKYKVKPVFYQIDEQPELDEEMFSLIEYLVKVTYCTYYDALKTIIPAGENGTVKIDYTLTRELSKEELDELTDLERAVCLSLMNESDAKKLKTDEDIKLYAGVQNISKQLNDLIERGIVTKNELFSKKIKPKTQQLVKLNEKSQVLNYPLTPKQEKVIDLIKQEETATIKELAYLAGVTESVITTLIKKDVLIKFKVEIPKNYGQLKSSIQKDFAIELSTKQNQVFDGILNLVKDEKANTSLLFGVTGSGKTGIYIKLIEEVINLGKTAILLVPEISLTPQLLNKFESYFGEKVAVIHSNLSINDRLITYKRIRLGNTPIVIGARSAIFAPLKNIGVIILDEEGEGSYKSDSSPRYHARDVARFRCYSPENNASLVLGSATPSIDSYNNAMNGKYHLFELNERFANATLPQVFIVDMLAEQKQNNYTPLSQVLLEQIEQNLVANEQTILLINRRGYNTYATCMECEEVLKCSNCDVSMTYHKANGFMMCHYCGKSENLDVKCPFCGGSHIKLTGIGTQKLENELETYFPNARILRMDSDTTGGKYSYEQYFSDFKNQKYDILVGTQMIAKGLDFPNVTLVGVLNADSGLYSVDYKASERIFSLITQVVGRSGRSEKAGRAYIQTMNIDNSTINYSANQDYRGFFKDELFARKSLKLPPYCSIVNFAFSGTNEDSVLSAANKAMIVLRENALECDKVAFQVLGISKATVYKVNNKFRYRMIVKCKLNNQMRKLISKTLIDCGCDKLFNNVSIIADVNGDI